MSKWCKGKFSMEKEEGDQLQRDREILNVSGEVKRET